MWWPTHFLAYLVVKHFRNQRYVVVLIPQEYTTLITSMTRLTQIITNNCTVLYHFMKTIHFYNKLNQNNKIVQMNGFYLKCNQQKTVHLYLFYAMVSYVSQLETTFVLSYRMHNLVRHRLFYVICTAVHLEVTQDTESYFN